ncbi:methionine-r-sulfoxide reductase [Colletotrichum karsti]|uniref:Peptide-methionine (R)-S-oxide reductase n=1 Tax=Colletotrichum karsti TaxID=1095194 RepID=A0A9P6I505_9PEZI|nr:methionine-r-sulfoxide reductase [Colletotrichum karsti]KAF9876349.1 methionine-r-sulfoxide reductase [Colletotrichum karsti]
MRFSPFFSTIVYTFSNLTRARAPQLAAVQQPFVTRPLRASMPTVPFLGALFGSSSSSQDKMSYPDKRSDDEWRAVLNKEQFRILRQKGTEPPGSGTYDKHYPSEGVYACAGCSAPLYKANHKFKSGCGWPAYFDSLPGAVVRHEDRTMGMARTEIVCANCGGHLGHVFKGEGFDTPTDERHCVNSVSLTFSPEEGKGEAKESKA